MTDSVRTAKARERGYKIARMHASGMTQREIGKELGICRQRVCQLLQAHRDRLDRERVAKVTEDGKHMIRIWRVG